MGMDGISIANTGIVKEQTSAEMASRTEQSIMSDSANSRQVQSATVNQRVKEKEEGEESGGKQKGRNNLKDTFDDGFAEESPDEELEPEIDVEDIENPNKEFYVKLNIKDDIIELYDSDSDRLVESISGEELGQLVQKLNMASGIFVNKKV